MENGTWKRRTDKEVCEFFQEPGIVGIVKAQRQKWVQPIIKMKHERIPNMIMRCSMGKRKRVSRPRKQWKKEVKDVIRMISIGQVHSERTQQEIENDGRKL